MKLLRETIRKVLLAEMNVPDYKYLYHGTTEEAAEAIKVSHLNYIDAEDYPEIMQEYQ